MCISFCCSATFSGTSAGDKPRASVGLPRILFLLPLSTRSVQVPLFLFTLHPIQPGTTFSTGTSLLRLVDMGLKEGTEEPPPPFQHTGKYLGQYKVATRCHQLHPMSFCTSSSSSEEENTADTQSSLSLTRGRPNLHIPHSSAAHCGMMKKRMGGRRGMVCFVSFHFWMRYSAFHNRQQISLI